MDILPKSLGLFCLHLQADPLAYAPAIVANYVGLWYESGAGVLFYELPWNPTSEILVLNSRPYF